MAALFQFVGRQFRLRRELRKPVNHRKGAFDDAKSVTVTIDRVRFRHFGGRIERHELGDLHKVGVALG